MLGPDRIKDLHLQRGHADLHRCCRRCRQRILCQDLIVLKTCTYKEDTLTSIDFAVDSLSNRDAAVPRHCQLDHVVGIGYTELPRVHVQTVVSIRKRGWPKVSGVV